MRRRSALLAALLLVAPVVAQAQAPTAERPVYVPGQRWVRSDGVFELVRIEGDRYVFATGPSKEVHLTKNLAIARTRDGQRFNEIDPPVSLKWPIEVGKWGIQNSIWRWTDNPNGVPAKLIWRVAAHEEVRVPAGVFQAFRIDMQVELSASWNKTFTAWYAPSARQYVKGGPGGMFWLDTFNVVSVDAPAPLRIALTAPAEAATVAIITASRPAEVSIELPELGHGIFTYYLVNGLKGAADLNRDGIVSLQELYEYVEQQVTTKSRAVGGNQHPVMKGEMEGVLPLTKGSGQ